MNCALIFTGRDIEFRIDEELIIEGNLQRKYFFFGRWEFKNINTRDKVCLQLSGKYKRSFSYDRFITIADCQSGEMIEMDYKWKNPRIDLNHRGFQYSLLFHYNNLISILRGNEMIGYINVPLKVTHEGAKYCGKFRDDVEQLFLFQIFVALLYKLEISDFHGTYSSNNVKMGLIGIDQQEITPFDSSWNLTKE